MLTVLECKEKFKLDYIRYMDDMILWSENKEKLIEYGYEFSSYAKNILHLTLKPFCLNRTEEGCPFLGFLLYPDKINLALRSRTRFIKKIRMYDLNLKTEAWSETEYQNHVLPLLSFVKYANSIEFRKQILKRIDEKTDIGQPFSIFIYERLMKKRRMACNSRFLSSKD